MNLFKKYYLLSIIIDGVTANVYIDQDYCKYLAKLNAKKKVTLLNKWRISRRQFNAFKEANTTE